MSMKRITTSGSMILLVFCMLFGSCGGSADDQLRLTVAASRARACRATVAEAGGLKICLDEITDYSGMANELRTSNDIPARDAGSAAGQVDLATELIALALQARAEHLQQSAAVAEMTKRLLARAYLDRLAAASDLKPISEREIRDAYKREKIRYMTTGKSKIFRPSTVNAQTVWVGYFPDLHSLGPGEKPVCSRDEALELARKIHAALSASGSDLDRFMAVARRFQSGHPCVVTKDYWRTMTDPQLSVMNRKMHAALEALHSVGQLSAPVVTDHGVVIIRRGYTRPGKGEQLSAVKDALVDKIRTQHRRALLKENMAALLKKYRARMWPGSLAASAGNRP